MSGLRRLLCACLGMSLLLLGIGTVGLGGAVDRWGIPLPAEPVDLGVVEGEVFVLLKPGIAGFEVAGEALPLADFGAVGRLVFPPYGFPKTDWVSLFSEMAVEVKEDVLGREVTRHEPSPLGMQRPTEFVKWGDWLLVLGEDFDGAFAVRPGEHPHQRVQVVNSWKITGPVDRPSFTASVTREDIGLHDAGLAPRGSSVDLTRDGAQELLLLGQLGRLYEYDIAIYSAPRHEVQERYRVEVSGSAVTVDVHRIAVQKPHMASLPLGGQFADVRFAVPADLGPEASVPSIVIDDASPGYLRIIIGLGRERFVLGPAFKAASGVLSVAVADFDGDGVPDLIVAGDSEIVFLRGTGLGPDGVPSFEIPRRVGLVERGVSLAVLDLNSDGRPDFAVANQGAGTVDYYLNSRTGGAFERAGRISMGNGQPVALVASDITGRGIEDVIVANRVTNEVIVLHSDGHGRLAMLPTTGWRIAGLLVELNREATVERRTSVETIQRLGLTTAVALERSDPRLGPAALGDFVEDGKKDSIVWVNTATKELSLVRGGTERRIGGVSVPHTPVAVASARLALSSEGAGRSQLVVAYDRSGLVEVYEISATASRLLGYGVIPGPGVTPGAVLRVDLSGDGVDEILVADLWSGRLFLLERNDTPLNDGHKAAVLFDSAREILATDRRRLPVALAAGDITGDGRVEIVIAEYGSKTIRVLRCDDEGNWVTYSSVNLDRAPRGVAIVDFDGSGKQDLAVTMEDVMIVLFGPDMKLEEKREFPVHGTPVDVWAGRDEGTPFIAVSLLRDVDGAPVPGSSIVWGDNGVSREFDCYVDPNSAVHGPLAHLAAGVEQGHNVLFVLQSSEPLRRTAGVLAMGPHGLDWELVRSAYLDTVATGFAIADLDGSGHLDVASLDTPSNRLTVFWGPTLSAATAEHLSTSAAPAAVAAGASREGAWVLGGGVAWVSADPDKERWERRMLDLAGGHPRSAVAASLCGVRSPPDLVILVHRPDLGTDEIRVFSGRDLLQGATTAWRAWIMPHRVSAFTVGDFNGDGRPDVAVAYQGQDTGQIWLGSGGRRELSGLGDKCIALAAGDVTGNGAEDIVALHSLAATARVSLYLRDSSGSFVRSAQELRVGFPMGTGGVLLGDVNHNGKLDIVVYDRATGLVVVLHNGGHQDMERTIAGLRIVDRGFVPSFAGVR